MRLRWTVWAASLAAALIAAPLSYEWVITVVGPIVLKVAWKTVETIGLVQLGILAVMLPIVGLTKLSERWPAVGGFVVLGGGIWLIRLWFAAGMPAGCGAGPQSAC